ncbi:Phosphopantothenoylcysteine decarboxylase [Lamellibrachia satsuma]|nr:Phosphopantothenoylcysteine decarboxylase [Lamellibrachia satsuma]
MADDKILLERNRVLIGCTGSVASIKIPMLVEQLSKLKRKLDIEVIVTEHATHFFDPGVLPCRVHTDSEEWTTWTSRSDPVLHIELRKWADLFLLAPLDANTLAKVATGLCDNLLTCVVRAWDLKKPFLFAPAMNTLMWEHPITATHITTLEGWGYKTIPCIAKKLACRDTGMGAMAEVATIVSRVQLALEDINDTTQAETG